MLMRGAVMIMVKILESPSIQCSASICGYFRALTLENFWQCTRFMAPWVAALQVAGTPI